MKAFDLQVRTPRGVTVETIRRRPHRLADGSCLVTVRGMSLTLMLEVPPMVDVLLGGKPGRSYFVTLPAGME